MMRIEPDSGTNHIQEWENDADISSSHNQDNVLVNQVPPSAHQEMSGSSAQVDSKHCSHSTKASVQVHQMSEVIRTPMEAYKSYKVDIQNMHQVYFPMDQAVHGLEVPTKSYASFIERSTSCPIRRARIPYKDSSWIARHVRNISRCSWTFQGCGMHVFSSSNRTQSNPSTKKQVRKDLIRFGFAFRPP